MRLNIPRQDACATYGGQGQRQKECHIFKLHACNELAGHECKRRQHGSKEHCNYYAGNKNNKFVKARLVYSYSAHCLPLIGLIFYAS